MRSSKQPKCNKRGLRIKIKKKRNGKYLYLPFGTHVSDNNIQNINEALRKNKSASCDSNGSWKLLPKDSCEVYRVRRRRQQNQRRDGSLSEDQVDQRQSKVQFKKTHKRRYRDAKKQNTTRRYYGRRPRSESTMYSNCDSHITTSSMSVCSSCASLSEMES